MTLLAVLAALGSALFVAVASVLQHRAGLHAHNNTLRSTFRQPVWVAGAVTGVLGFLLHVVALSAGALSLVQPILVTGLLFALPLSHALQHSRIRAVELLAGASVVAGLAVFQFTARPAAGASIAGSAALAWSTAVAVGTIGLALLVMRRHRRHRATWLGFCTGAGYGLVAALLKTSVGVLAASGLSAMVTTWPLWAFLVVVTAVILINQLAFNAGPLALSLPLITIIDPIVSVAVGAVAFGETVASGAALGAAQVAGFALMTGGVVVLSRHAAPPPTSAADPRAVTSGCTSSLSVT